MSYLNTAVASYGHWGPGGPTKNVQIITCVKENVLMNLIFP
jgi:hypothetical protein